MAGDYTCIPGGEQASRGCESSLQAMLAISLLRFVQAKMMGGAHSTGRPERGWEHFTHIADVGVRGFGTTMGEAFEQAALAMTAITCDPGAIQARSSVPIDLEAPNAEILLADWLNAIVFEMATRRMLFSRFTAQISGNRLSGSLGGEAVDVPRHQPAVEIKGATLSELKVGQDEDGRWFAQCVVDV